jgi:hypothetical protein
MGPQAMEGALHLTPGTTIKAGYDFTLPGNHNSLYLHVTSAKLTFTGVRCTSNATPSATSFTLYFPTQAYQVTDDQWYPSGDQHSSLVYQGQTSVPNLCDGAALDLSHGATFTADLH